MKELYGYHLHSFGFRFAHLLRTFYPFKAVCFGILASIY